MTVDRYTKFILTVIAVCLTWMVLGPSAVPAVNAQVGERVILAGWIDDKGAFQSFPAVPVNVIGGKLQPRGTIAALPVSQTP